jgi:acetate kinase
MTDAILILNAGSSSLKFSVFLVDCGGLALNLRGHVENLHATPHFAAFDAQANLLMEHRWKGVESLDHTEAAQYLLRWLPCGQSTTNEIQAVGHRVVHGGLDFANSVLVNDDVLLRLERLVPLAPLHQPQSLAVIRTVAQALPQLPQVASFDTSFHRQRCHLDQLFALPRRFTDAGVRRYGFHGLSYEYIASRLHELDPAAFAGRTVVAHLGNGASLCALRAGQSVATTMGFTALDGLPMGTRCGTIDPGVVLYLMNEYQLDAHQVEHLLYHESGLRALSGISPDVRTLLASPDPRAQEAIDFFVYRIGRELGSLAAALGGLDTLVFTAGIGEHAAPIRAAISRDAAWLGIELDETKNNAGGPQISRADSRVSVLVIPTDEEQMIARQTQRVLGSTSNIVSHPG